MGRGLRPLAIAPVIAALALAVPACGSDDDGDVAPVDDVAPDAPRDEAPGVGGEDEPRGAGENDGGREADRAERPRGGSEERRVVEAVRAVLASGDPGLACADAVTERYVREGYGSGQSCRLAQEPETVATSVAVTGIDIDGARATAVARPDGGLYDGMELDVRLVHEAAAWRVDRLRADVPPGP